MIIVGCSNQDFGKEVKEVCTIGCIGCRACAKRSPMFSFEGHGVLPKINYDAYDPDQMDGTRLAIEKCPVKGLIFVGQPTPEDKEAVKDESLPTIVHADFKTTADDAEWQG